MRTTSVINWTEANLEELASLAVEARYELGLTNEVESIKDYIDRQNQSGQNSSLDWVVATYEHDELCGWARIWKWDIDTMRVGNWQPFLREHSSEVATEIIKNIINKVREEYLAIVHVAFSRVNKKRQQVYDRYYQWYLQLGFYDFYQEYFMIRHLEDYRNIAIQIPKRFDVTSLDDWEGEKLCNVYLNAFTNSNDRFFKQRTLENRKNRFMGILASNHTLRDASYVMSKQDEIVGFSIVTDHFPPAHLGPFAIVPEFRGMQLGRRLALLSMKSVAAMGHNMMSLEVDIENHPAPSFYKNLGFEIESKSHVLHWMKK